MVSAADLQRQHGGQSNGTSNSNGNSTSEPMNDPFPALTEDPFPPTAASNVIQYPPIGSKNSNPSASNGATANGDATAYKKPGLAQPDL